MQSVLLIALTILFAFGTSLSSIAAPKVVASIMPVHSLAASLMKGVGEPSLIIPANVSPHRFALKPSQRKAIAEADLVFGSATLLKEGWQKHYPKRSPPQCLW